MDIVTKEDNLKDKIKEKAHGKENKTPSLPPPVKPDLPIPIPPTLFPPP
jgi:hypothetical protein